MVLFFLFIYGILFLNKGGYYMSEWIQPLAFKMKPTIIEEVVGQEHLLGDGKILKTMIDTKTLFSFILYGNSGIGKTSIAIAIAGSTQLPLEMFNASTDTKKDLQKIVEQAKEQEQTTFLFIDEIHRMTKPIQDFLLPFMENGLIVVIGATTENPYISVNPAMRSRSKIYELKPLTQEHITQIITNALTNKEKGLGNKQIILNKPELDFLAHSSGGDARTALNNLELASNMVDKETGIITQTILEECLQTRNFDYGSGDSLYNTLSAFQKSLRGSDVNASLHYLARLLEGGELEYACRRLMISVYEDVGLASPNLPMIVKNAIDTALQAGMPEARIPLGFATTLVALSEKSNVAYLGINNALEDLKFNGTLDIPTTIHDTHYQGASELGKGGYQYPFDFENNIVEQQYLPDKIKHHTYFLPNPNSPIEKKYFDKLKQINKTLKPNLKD